MRFVHINGSTARAARNMQIGYEEGSATLNSSRRSLIAERKVAMNYPSLPVCTLVRESCIHTSPSHARRRLSGSMKSELGVCTRQGYFLVVRSVLPADTVINKCFE